MGQIERFYRDQVQRAMLDLAEQQKATLTEDSMEPRKVFRDPTPHMPPIPAACDAPHKLSIDGQVSYMLERLARIQAKTGRIADRLGANRPPTVAQNGGPPSSNSIHSLLDVANSIACCIEDDLDNAANIVGLTTD